MGTNVTPDDLNYNHHETKKYDSDIVCSIPGHKELHDIIESIVKEIPGLRKVLELGIGTGVTAERILRIFTNAQYRGIDFSEQMLEGATMRLIERYCFTGILGDYSKIDLPDRNSLVVSVIGIHHQETDEDKRNLFQRIYNSLNKGGTFIFGDLVTYRNPEEAALNDALHYHHLIENATDEQTLKEWTHHHKYLNKLAPLEDQIDWLKEIGFKEIELAFQKYNTALVVAKT